MTHELKRILKQSYWREDDARLVVAAFEESGKSATRFADEQGIRAKRLLRWRRRFRRGRMEGAPRMQFVEVTPPESEQPTSPSEPQAPTRQHDAPLEVVVGRHRVLVYGEFAPSMLRQVVAALETPC